MLRPNLKSVRVGDEIYVRIGTYEKNQYYKAIVEKVTAQFVYTAKNDKAPRGKFCKNTGLSCGKSERSAWTDRRTYFRYLGHMRMLRGFYQDLKAMSADEFDEVKVAKVRKILNIEET